MKKPKYKLPRIGEIARLLRSLKPEIDDEYRATDSPDDITPGMCVTIGASPNGTWSYQTGDNSFTGGAYGHRYWGVVYLYRRSNCKDLAREVIDEIAEGMAYGEEPTRRTLTDAEAAERKQLRERADAFAAWLGVRSSYRPEEVPAGLDFSNEERSRLEVLDFIAEAPGKYFAYVKEVPGTSPVAPAFGLTPKLDKITTWAGDTLAKVTKTGDAWRDNLGGERVPFTCEAISGLTYHGTYYKSSGTYCRMKLAKNQ